MTPHATRMNPTSPIETPTPVNGTVRFLGPPRRIPNRERRSREHLTEREVELLMATAKGRGRYGHRDATMILLAYRHGFRVSELVSLRWDQVDLNEGRLHVNRVKRGTASVHPLRGPELRALRKLEREGPTGGAYVFASERGGPMTAAGFRKLLARTGEESAVGLPVPPPHAPPRLRLQARERRPRHPGDPALPGAQEHSAYRSLY